MNDFDLPYCESIIKVIFVKLATGCAVNLIGDDVILVMKQRLGYGEILCINDVTIRNHRPTGQHRKWLPCHRRQLLKNLILNK